MVASQLLQRLLLSTAPCAQAYFSSSLFVLTPSLSHQLLVHLCHKNRLPRTQPQAMSGVLELHHSS